MTEGEENDSHSFASRISMFNNAIQESNSSVQKPNSPSRNFPQSRQQSSSNQSPTLDEPSSNPDTEKVDDPNEDLQIIKPKPIRSFLDKIKIFNAEKVDESHKPIQTPRKPQSSSEFQAKLAVFSSPNTDQSPIKSNEIPSKIKIPATFQSLTQDDVSNDHEDLQSSIPKTDISPPILFSEPLPNAANETELENLTNETHTKQSIGKEDDDQQPLGRFNEFDNSSVLDKLKQEVDHQEFDQLNSLEVNDALKQLQEQVANQKGKELELQIENMPIIIDKLEIANLNTFDVEDVYFFDDDSENEENENETKESAPSKQNLNNDDEIEEENKDADEFAEVQKFKSFQQEIKNQILKELESNSQEKIQPPIENENIQDDELGIGEHQPIEEDQIEEEEYDESEKDEQLPMKEEKIEEKENDESEKQLPIETEKVEKEKGNESNDLEKDEQTPMKEEKIEEEENNESEKDEQTPMKEEKIAVEEENDKSEKQLPMKTENVEKEEKDESENDEQLPMKEEKIEEEKENDESEKQLPMETENVEKEKGNESNDIEKDEQTPIEEEIIEEEENDESDDSLKENTSIEKLETEASPQEQIKQEVQTEQVKESMNHETQIEVTNLDAEQRLQDQPLNENQSNTEAQQPDEQSIKEELSKEKEQQNEAQQLDISEQPKILSKESKEDGNSEIEEKNTIIPSESVQIDKQKEEATLNIQDNTHKDSNSVRLFDPSIASNIPNDLKSTNILNSKKERSTTIQSLIRNAHSRNRTRHQTKSIILKNDSFRSRFSSSFLMKQRDVSEFIRPMASIAPFHNYPLHEILPDLKYSLSGLDRCIVGIDIGLKTVRFAVLSPNLSNSENHTIELESIYANVAYNKKTQQLTIGEKLDFTNSEYLNLANGIHELAGLGYHDPRTALLMMHLPFNVGPNVGIYAQAGSSARLGCAQVSTDIENEPKTQGIKHHPGHMRTFVFTGESFLTFLFTKVKDVVKSETLLAKCDAVVSVPACYDQSQREAIINAAKLAGIDVIRLIDATIAASLTIQANQEHEYKLQNKPYPTKTMVIIDAGGTKTDVSIVRQDSNTTFEYVTVGTNDVVADDIRCAYIDTVNDCFKAQNPEISEEAIRKNVTAQQRLSEEIDKAMVELSAGKNATIYLQNFVDNKDIEFRFETKDFNESCAQIVQKTNELLEEAFSGHTKLHREEIQQNKDFENNKCRYTLSRDDINEIHLVGGATQLPGFEDMLMKFFNFCKLRGEVEPQFKSQSVFINSKGASIPVYQHNPDVSVVSGTVICAATQILYPIKKLFLSLNHNIGYKSQGGLMNNFLMKGAVLPALGTIIKPTFGNATASIWPYGGFPLNLINTPEEFDLSQIDDDDKSLPYNGIITADKKLNYTNLCYYFGFNELNPNDYSIILYDVYQGPMTIAQNNGFKCGTIAIRVPLVQSSPLLPLTPYQTQNKPNPLPVFPSQISLFGLPNSAQIKPRIRPKSVAQQAQSEQGTFSWFKRKNKEPLPLTKNPSKGHFGKDKRNKTKETLFGSKNQVTSASLFYPKEMNDKAFEFANISIFVRMNESRMIEALAYDNTQQCYLETKFVGSMINSAEEASMFLNSFKVTLANDKMEQEAAIHKQNLLEMLYKADLCSNDPSLVKTNFSNMIHKYMWFYSFKNENDPQYWQLRQAKLLKEIKSYISDFKC